MDLNNNTLEGWLEHAPPEAFYMRRIINYYSYYITLKDYLYNNVHKWVTIGANLKDPLLVLNDHGPDHVTSVMDRASHLVSGPDCKLNALEVYLLITAIQLHDVGNIFGRYEHELKAEDIMLEADKLCGRDDVERAVIKKIVQAHGGKIRGITNGVDKIGLLKQEDYLFNEEIKLQAIAGILRFADELADDKGRANTVALRKGELPKASEVFHAYSACLDSVLIKHDHKSIELYFKIPKDFAIRQFGKLDKEVYLLDEIYNRIMKMHLERIYSMRFCKKLIDIDRIYVCIDFYDKYLVDIFPQINFEVSETGYPSVNENGLFGLCSKLTDETGTKIDGAYVKNKLAGI